MSTHFFTASRGITTAALALGLFIGLAATSATAAEPLQNLAAPFTCGTEWSGVTRSGHGLNDWNLDINRTSRSFDEPDHDLGQPILAQGDGTVVYLGNHVSAGTYLEVDYGDITVRYIHLVDESIPDHLAEIGAALTKGEEMGQLGDTGNATHAHLHLGYFDSRDYPDTPWWQLPASNQVQITMDGVAIGPGDAFISTNCDGPPPSTTTTTTTPPPSHPFVDIGSDSYADDDVALLYHLAITTGTSETEFSPAAPVSRDHMAAFLARIWRLLRPDHVAPDTGFPFDDVDADSFAYADIQLLHSLEITLGTGPRTYSPTDDVTREQMAAFLGRLWGLLFPAEPGPDGPFPFDDVDPESFAYDDINLLWHLSITKGTGQTTYSPDDIVSREQMAAFLGRLLRAAGLTPPG